MVKPIHTAYVYYRKAWPSRPSIILTAISAVASRGEAKRLIAQHAVRVYYPDSLHPISVITDDPIRLCDDMLLRVGKRRWFRIKVPRWLAEVYEFTSLKTERAFLGTCPHISPEDIERTLKEDWGRK